MDIKSILRIYKNEKSWYSLKKLIRENQKEETMHYIKKYCKCDENMVNDFFNIFSKLCMLEKDEAFLALSELIREKQTEEAMDYIQVFCKCDEDMAKILLDCYIERLFYDIYHPTPQSLAEAAHNNQVAQDWLNKPKCPICNSTNLAKITATKKIAKMAAFGIFGMGDNGKTWRCKNCGSKF